MTDPKFTSAAMTPSSLTILLVDDIQENIDLLQDLFQEQGYQVRTTQSSLEALEIAQGAGIHLIVADAMMPKMDGLELCKKVKQQPSRATIPFIIYTGNYVDQEDEELARGIGVDRYVMKYAGTNLLIEAVNELALQRYGFQGEPSAVPPVEMDEHVFLKRHHGLVTKKLEEKMAELQIYADTLEQRNRELIISEKRYRTLFENASVAIFIADSRQHRVVDMNRQAMALLRCTLQEIPEIQELPFYDDAGVAIDVFNLQENVTREATLRTHTGERLDIDISAGPVGQPNDTRVMLFVRDITDAKRMRDHLLQTEKMALMGRLAAGIAHEIRNPLAGIALNLQYLNLKVTADSPDHESIDAALEGTQRIQQVIEDTLGLARVTPATLMEEPINSVITRTLHYLTVPLRQKGVRVETQYGDSLPPVLMDSKQIQQVLLNILQNAIDASPSGGVISIETRAWNGEPEPTVEVLIRDRGPGLAPEIAQRLFEGFRTTKEGGTGLGLMLSKFIIDRHRGTIAIANAPDGGTIVRLAFPITEQERITRNAER